MTNTPFDEARHMAGLSFHRPLTEDEQDVWAKYIDETYGTDFLRRLTEWRADRA